MPIQRCREDGKPGFRWGDSGECFTYTPGDSRTAKEARAQAEKEAAKIELERFRRGETSHIESAQKPRVTLRALTRGPRRR